MTISNRRISPPWLLSSLAAFSLLWVAGCGPNASVTSGSVLFDDGSPVQAGRIEFRDLSSGDRFVSIIEPDGGFTPQDPDGDIGLPPGKYEVVVVQMVLTEDLAAEDHSHGGTVPRRYADYHTSGLRQTVTNDDAGPIRVEIESS